MNEADNGRILVRSLSTQGEEISLSQLLGVGVLRGRITELQLASGQSWSPEDLAQLGNEAFGSNILPVQVRIYDDGFNDRDSFFAQRFGFKLIPHFAFLQVKHHPSLNRIKIKAWASPALLPPNHPLVQVSDGKVAVLTTEPVEFSSERSKKPSFDVFSGFGDTTPMFYMRLTALDEPLALSQICKVLGTNQINIKGVEQPESLSGSAIAEIGLILDPALTVNFKTAKKMLNDLPVCQVINSVLPVMG